jgi:hypothetical protein
MRMMLDNLCDEFKILFLVATVVKEIQLTCGIRGLMGNDLTYEERINAAVNDFETKDDVDTPHHIWSYAIQYCQLFNKLLSSPYRLIKTMSKEGNTGVDRVIGLFLGNDAAEFYNRLTRGLINLKPLLKTGEQMKNILHLLEKPEGHIALDGKLIMQEEDEDQSLSHPVLNTPHTSKHFMILLLIEYIDTLFVDHIDADQACMGISDITALLWAEDVIFCCNLFRVEFNEWSKDQENKETESKRSWKYFQEWWSAIGVQSEIGECSM